MGRDGNGPEVAVRVGELGDLATTLAYRDDVTSIVLVRSADPQDQDLWLVAHYGAGGGEPPGPVRFAGGQA